MIARRRVPAGLLRLRLLTALVVGLVGLGAGACKDKPLALAEIVQLSGPPEALEKAGADDAWRRAGLGDKLYLGDAVRTKDARALLRLGDASRLEMEPETLVRFGRRGDSAKQQQLLVETGAIELAGSGEYQLDIGEIAVGNNGGVRISASDQGSRVELLVGKASIRTEGGELRDLEKGVALELSDIQIRGLGAERADAGVVDAAEAAVTPDAPPPAAQVAVSVTGKGAEVRAADGKWRALREGEALAPGTSLRPRSRSSARLDNGAVTLELESGGVATVGADRSLTLSAGSASARAAPGAGGEVALPGGAVALRAHPSGSRTEITVGRSEAKVRVVAGLAGLAGSGDALELRRGESASLSAAGAVRSLAAAPRTFDVGLSAGESATIHDGRGTAAVQIRFAESCAGDGVIELASSASFRSPQVASGQGAANVLVPSGSHHYRVRCEGSAGDSRPVASGRLTITRDSGRRALVAAPPPFHLAVDGRTYRVGYQGAIPAMTVEWKGASGRGYVLHLAAGGKEQTFPASGPIATIAGQKLREGAYTLWFEKGEQRSKVSTLLIDFDNTAPAVYVDEPDDGDAWGAEVAIKGAVLPDWTVSVDGVALPLDRQRRFSASVPAPSSNTLAIKLSHPQRGVHYYLRRRK